MPRAVPPVPGLPRYTRWSDVPDDLFTRTQLGRLEPPRKPGGEPVAQVLYMGNSYAPLYPLAEAVEKRRATPAQRAVLARALELQYVCRRCERQHDWPLGRGRWCDPCRRAAVLWQLHDQAQQLARELVADPGAAVLVVDVEPGALPGCQQVAVVGLRDREVLYAVQAGEPGSAQREAVVERLDVLFTDRRVVIEPNSLWSDRWPSGLLPVDEWRSSGCGAHPLHPWATRNVRLHPSVAYIWAEWFGWTDHPTSRFPTCPGHRAEGPWGRSLDAAVDGLAMARLLHRISEGTEPVADNAAWADGLGIPVIPAGAVEVAR